MVPDLGFRHAGYEYPTFDSQEEQMAADPLVVDVFKAFFPEGPTRPPCSRGSRGTDMISSGMMCEDISGFSKVVLSVSLLNGTMDTYNECSTEKFYTLNARL